MTLKDAPHDHLASILKQNSNRMDPESLWKSSQLTIDDFYEKLKQEELDGLLVEETEDRLAESRFLRAC